MPDTSTLAGAFIKRLFGKVCVALAPLPVAMVAQDASGNPVVPLASADGSLLAGNPVRVRHDFHLAPTESLSGGIPLTALGYFFAITGTGNDNTVGSNTAHAAGVAQASDYAPSVALALTAGAAAYIDGFYLTAP